MLNFLETATELGKLLEKNKQYGNSYITVPAILRILSQNSSASSIPPASSPMSTAMPPPSSASLIRLAAGWPGIPTPPRTGGTLPGMGW